MMNAAHILLVEDDPDIRAITVLALQLHPDFRVTPIESGSDALAYLRQSPMPDLILIDNILPDMDGVSLAQEIRLALIKAPPFAFFTASVRPSDTKRYSAAGAVGTIAKPFDPTRLAAQIRALCLSKLT